MASTNDTIYNVDYNSLIERDPILFRTEPEPQAINTRMRPFMNALQFSQVLFQKVKSMPALYQDGAVAKHYNQWLL